MHCRPIANRFRVALQKRCFTEMLIWSPRVSLASHGYVRAMLFNSSDYLVPIERIVCDEEALPFAEDSHDAIMSCLSLHWVNDLPGELQASP